MSTKKKLSDNRHKIGQFFITLPRWKDVDDLHEIYKMLPPTNWCYIVKEFHDDVDPDKSRNSNIHYHMSVILRNKISKKKLLAWFENIFPNDYKRIDIEATKNFEATLLYMQKESKICFESGTRPVALAKKKAISLQKITTEESQLSWITQMVMYGCNEEREMEFQRIYSRILKHLWNQDLSYCRKDCENFLKVLKYCRAGR